MKRLVLVLLLMPSIVLAAQTARKEDHLEKLNEQMWIPFIRGINADEAKLYVGIHSDEFHWVAPGSNGRIMDFEQYAEDSIAVMKRRAAEGTRSEVQIRFLERNVNASGSFAAEKCVVKFTLLREGKPPETSYGVAHYFSRKEGENWRMILQYGSTEKGNEGTFAAAAPIEDTARFQPKPIS